jgi:TPP-dependent pyruvate/acetoin dehydrogenase alpha subunit
MPPPSIVGYSASHQTASATMTTTAAMKKMSRYRIDGGDLAALTGLLVKARAKAEQSGKLVRIPDQSSPLTTTTPYKPG